MSGLDPIGRRQVRDLILQLKAAGKTVFFSTHILSDAEALCDRVAILNRGELVGVGPISQMVEQRTGYEAVLECSSPEVFQKLESLAAKPMVVSGGQCRLVISEQNVRALLALSQADGVRLLSLNPVRFSLEDYFVKILRGGDAAPAQNQ